MTVDPFKILNNIKRYQLKQYDFEGDADSMRRSDRWKENRDEFLSDKNKCQWCRNKKDELHVHHEWTKSFSRQWIKATDDAFIASDEYKSSLTNNREECPNCGKRDYYSRKTKTPRYRCNNCKSEFSSLNRVPGKEAILNDEYPNKPYTTNEYHEKKADWIRKNKSAVKEKFDQRYRDLMKEYSELRSDQVTAICKRCHYLEEKTKKKRCQECQENWYDPSKIRDNMCWDCVVQQKGLEECPDCGDNWYQPSKNDKCQNCRN